MGQSDAQWVRRCLDSHPEAFRHFVERHQGGLLGYLAGRLGSREKATEVAQETFVRAYFALGRLHKPESFFAWLVGIADRVIKETRRKEQRRPVALAEPVTVPAPAESASLGPEIAGAVAELPEPYRQVVLLRFYAGQSCKEIAGNLEIPVGTVTKRLSRAYALLRKALQESDPTPGSEVRRSTVLNAKTNWSHAWRAWWTRPGSSRWRPIWPPAPTAKPSWRNSGG